MKPEIASTANDLSALGQPLRSALQHSFAIVFTAEFFGGTLIAFANRVH